MEKIGIYFLGHRRLKLLECHLKHISKTKFKNFHFYLLSNNADKDNYFLMKKYLPTNSSMVINFDEKNDYMSKIKFALDRDHEFSIKMDEDCLLTTESWDRFFSLIESLKNEDLFCTGAISNGIPSCDFFIKNFIPEATNELYAMFSSTIFGRIGGVDYSPLNQNYPDGWDSNKFYESVWKINHHYMGIHPVRVNFDAAKKINDYILKNLNKSMSPIHGEVIRDVNKYPYFCNSFFGIKTSDWREIVHREDLFVDSYEEVPLNKFRQEKNKNMVLDTGIPILHTMYNWSQNWNYENDLIEKLVHKL
jgi:hypothetical protein